MLLLASSGRFNLKCYICLNSTKTALQPSLRVLWRFENELNNYNSFSTWKPECSFRRKCCDSITTLSNNEELQQFKKFSDDIRTYIVDCFEHKNIHFRRTWQRYQTESEKLSEH